jgi:predicted dehydrogenase
MFEVLGIVTRDIERAREWAKPYEVKCFSSLDELLAQSPLFVISSLPSNVNPTILAQLAEKGVPSLSETPPARSIEEMESLFRLVQSGAKIAVAEQYHLQPHHEARIQIARSGKLGTISQAQVSAAHGYHGISLIRRLLDIQFENAKITARRFISPIVRGLQRSGLPEKEEVTESVQTIAYLNFGDKLAVFDFTDDQYRSFIRKQRILLRGERGELINEHLIYLQDYQTPIELDLRRINTGERGNLEGYFFKGIQLGEEWIYKNPLAPASLNDEDIAVGQCLLKMADYVHGATAFYSLAEACQDRYLHIMLEKAAETGDDISTTTQIWAS